MSLFDKIFQKEPRPAQGEQFFKTFNAYTPIFTTWNGALYESELVRSALDARARHISKLQVQFDGAAKAKLKTAVAGGPNEFQTWGQFLYRLSTILDMQNTAFIVPVLDRYLEMRGYYCVLPSQCSIVEFNGKQWLRYKFSTGDIGAVELNRCGIMTKFQYKDDFFGEKNNALSATMELIDIQHQGIAEAVKNSASFRFMAKLTNFKSPEDLAKEQQNFSSKNLAADSGGLLLFPNTYGEIQQITSNPFTVDTAQMEMIQTNVYNYYGVNEEILQNKALGDSLDAFYEGSIEPFAIQLSDVMTNMTFTALERGYGARVQVNANRLQYMKTSDKVNFIKELGDRGLITINEARDLLNYGPLPADVGDLRPIRGEYYLQDSDGNIVKKDQTEEPAQQPPEDDGGTENDR